MAKSQEVTSAASVCSKTTFPYQCDGWFARGDVYRQRLRTITLLCVGLLLSLGTGCAGPFGTAPGGVIDTFVQNQVNRMRDHVWAKRAYYYHFPNGGHVHDSDFYEGFMAGYCGCCDGQTEVPVVAPERYWNFSYRSEEGMERQNAWFAGFEAGLESGQSDGVSRFTEIQISQEVQDAILAEKAVDINDLDLSNITFTEVTPGSPYPAYNEHLVTPGTVVVPPVSSNPDVVTPSSEIIQAPATFRESQTPQLPPVVPAPNTSRQPVEEPAEIGEPITQQATPDSEQNEVATKSVSEEKSTPEAKPMVEVAATPTPESPVAENVVAESPALEKNMPESNTPVALQTAETQTAETVEPASLPPIVQKPQGHASVVIAKSKENKIEAERAASESRQANAKENQLPAEEAESSSKEAVANAVSVPQLPVLDQARLKMPVPTIPVPTMPVPTKPTGVVNAEKNELPPIQSKILLAGTKPASSPVESPEIVGPESVELPPIVAPQAVQPSAGALPPIVQAGQLPVKPGATIVAAKREAVAGGAETLPPALNVPIVKR